MPTIERRIGKRLGTLLRVPAATSVVEWAPRHVNMPSQTETPGRFDLDMVPHVRGILEAWDDPHVRQLYLCLAARLAKTTTAIACMMDGAANDPAPALFVSADRDKTIDTVDAQYYPMLEACRATRPLLHPPHRRNKHHINCRDSLIRLAWSRSPSRISGYPAKRIHCSEVSKWSDDVSSEADAVYLVEQRAKNYPFDSKIIYESTPALLGRCKITTLLTREGTLQLRYRVPCPHCGEYQLLIFGDETTPNGIKWEKGRSGRSEPNRAEETAWYQCANGCRIENEQRPVMMRRGVWLADSESIDTDGNVSGERLRSPHVGFGPLGSWYSLMIGGWGQIAREFLDARYDREKLRNFVNSTCAEPWDPSPPPVKESELAGRIGSDDPPRMVPDWACFLTVGIDVSALADDYLFHWVVCAWGPGERCAIIDIGQTATVAEMQRQLVGWQYPLAADPERFMPVGRVGIDSGSFSQAMYELCKPFRNFAWPLKGSSASLENPFPKRDFPEMFRGIMQRAGRDPRLTEALRKRREYDLLEVNTHRSQLWLEDRLCGRIKRDDPCWFSVPCELLEVETVSGVDLRKHLLGDYLSETGTWSKRYESQHYRDALRYAVVMAYQRTRNGADWGAVRRQSSAAKPAMRAATVAPAPKPAGGWLPRR